MKNELISVYMKDIEKYSLLSASEEKELVIKAQAGDRKAKDLLVNSNLRFVVKTANSFKKSGLPLEDLISEGNLGLIKAIEKFDTDRSVRFLTYAVWWIKESIRKYIMANGRIVRIPVGNKEAYMDEKWNCVSLDQTIDSNIKKSGEFKDALVDDKLMSPDKQLELESDLRELGVIINSLPPREQQLLVARYGLDGSRPKTLRETGAYMGVSRETVRQMEAKVLLKLQKMAA